MNDQSTGDGRTSDLLEASQDDVIERLDELNTRILNLIELYNRLREGPAGRPDGARPELVDRLDSADEAA